MARVLLVALLLFAAPLFANSVVTAPSPEVVIPVVGSLPGANGTFYRTEVDIESYKNSPQRVRFTFLPQAGSGGTAIEKDVTFSAAWTEDILLTLLERSGMGTLIIRGITSQGAPDPTAKLVVTARIWTAQPDGGEGTYSQTISAIPVDSIETGSMTIHGMRADEQFRVNVGIVNLDPATAQTFSITYHTRLPGQAREVIVTVPPRSMQQVPLPNAPHGNLVVNVRPRTFPGIRLWTAYGSTVDNVTGDAWTVMGFESPDDPFFVGPNN